jgi:hypothetical protein
LKISLEKVVPPKSLSWRDKWLFWKAVSLALFIRVSLKMTSFKKTVRFLKRFEEPKTVAENGLPELKKYRALLNLAYRLPPFVNCLAISVAFWLLMKRKGIKTDLKFGMLKEGEKLRAHAWLEYNGSPIAPDKRYDEKYIAFSESIL